MVDNSNIGRMKIASVVKVFVIFVGQTDIAVTCDI
jgi:hypothetical protein